jgi:predicted methyltransferase
LSLLLLVWATTAVAVVSTQAPAQKKSPQAPAEKAKQRADSVRAIVAHLGLGEGAAVADIGAGDGPDSWTLADVVGERGTVFAEEISDSKVKKIKDEAEKRGLTQVRAVLGRSDDPCLPANSADLAFVRYVYHHFSKPREMLRGIRTALKPGGYLVVVDKRPGTLRDWVPREQRATKHFWIAETTVVREAREEGFLFVECAEPYWHEKDTFVLIFQRPASSESPAGDPDPGAPLPVEEAAPWFLPLGRPYQRPVFVALGESRKLIAPILRHTSGQAVEIVLEEWATQKDERPPLPVDVSFPSRLTDNGDPQLGPEAIDAVFFLDSYHLLFHGPTLLARLRERLSPTGCVYILDRRADRPLSRREASHYRMIQAETVQQEMSEAGFHLWFTGPPPASDRFLLVFGRVPSRDVAPETDPLVAGPEIDGSPGRWLQQNRWRLRGLKPADGRLVRLDEPPQKDVPEPLPTDSPDKEIWRLPSAGLVLSFDKSDGKYILQDCRRD